EDARIARKLRWQADRVLLGAEDVRGASARKAREDLLELPPRKSMVVGKERLVHDLCAERARGLTKGIRPRQASDEEDARAPPLRPLHLGGEVGPEDAGGAEAGANGGVTGQGLRDPRRLLDLCRSALVHLGDPAEVCAAEGHRRLAQRAARKQPPVAEGRAAVEDHQVEVAVKREVLKAVVEDQDL